VKLVTHSRVIAAWAIVCLPLAWGAYATVQRALALFA
jgi:hypothetical protein